MSSLKAELTVSSIFIEYPVSSIPIFLEKLFEQEIPEVFDGLITIKKSVRISGEKAKREYCAFS